MRAVDLDAVEPCHLHVQGRLAVAPDDVGDVLPLHLHRHLAMHDRGDSRRGPERMPLVHDRRALVVHTTCEQLDKLLAAKLVNGVSKLRVLGDDAFLPGGAATVK